MNTGKVEYSPDYKSKSRVKRIAAQMGQPFNEFLAEQMRDPEFAETYKAVDIKVEHQRLQVAVAEAAKAYRQSRAIGHASIRITSACRVCQDEKVFNAAVDALIAFEAENRIGEING